MSFLNSCGDFVVLFAMVIYGLVFRLLIPGLLVLAVILAGLFVGTKLLRKMGHGRILDEAKLRLGYWIADLVGVKVRPIDRSHAAVSNPKVVSLQQYRKDKHIG